MPDAPAGRPLLVFDGDCTFCRYWARYWQQLTGERVRYAPYQEVASELPAIAPEEFRRAVQYVAADGRMASAAEASFLTLSHARGMGLWLALYRRIPAFAAVAEFAYAFIATHRGAFYRLSLCLWGPRLEVPHYRCVAYLFLRGFGLIYACAFASFAVQALGLIGSHGILPLPQFIAAASHALGPGRFFAAPMVFWLSCSDLAIQTVCWGGVLLSLLLALNLLPRISLLALHLLYLSLLYGGQAFTTYQWDTYLLETGCIALILTLSTRTGIWLLRWLVFRFMFMSGVVKLASGDPSWWHLSALSYHFYTQPLPTPLAWYAAQLPAALLKLATGSMLAIELGLVFLIFAPRRLRFLAAVGILTLQGIILCTGNYNWFNLQTMLLCLVLFDDAALRSVLPRRLQSLLSGRARTVIPARLGGRLIALLAGVLVLQSLIEMDLRFGGQPPAAALALERLLEPVHATSAYGLFAVMTTERDEIVIEGSYDGQLWKEYEFPYKPGDVLRAPPWNIPHQPRLDWQMWFAALEDPRSLPWFARFLQKLLEGDPQVTALLRANPFPGRPPTYVRALFYEYRFAAPGEAPAGRWWDRRLLGLYTPAVRLRTP